MQAACGVHGVLRTQAPCTPYSGPPPPGCSIASTCVGIQAPPQGAGDRCRGQPLGGQPAVHLPVGSLDRVGVKQGRAVASKAPGQEGTSCARGEQASRRQEATREDLRGQTEGLIKGPSEEDDCKTPHRPQAGGGGGEGQIRKERTWVHRHRRLERANERRTQEPAGIACHLAGRPGTTAPQDDVRTDPQGHMCTCTHRYGLWGLPKLPSGHHHAHNQS